MPKSGGAAILMRQSLFNEKQRKALSPVTFLVGNLSRLSESGERNALCPFDGKVIDFLNCVAQKLLRDKRSKDYPDVITLGFWIRKSSVMKLKRRFGENDGNVRVGRGIAFHIAPSNVPVNFAYSLFSGLMTGNKNIVRVPSKDFAQVEIIREAINEALVQYAELAACIYLVRYERSQEINDAFSDIADIRIVWGGDHTIAELRRSPLRARACEVAFADRYSLAIIDSDQFLKLEDKDRLMEGFYNDTYLTDQNACTSPRIVVWTGANKSKARELFWEKLHSLVQARYTFQPVMGVNKLTNSYRFAATHSGTREERHDDNLILRVKVEKLSKDMMEYKGNAGYFFEYDCGELAEIRDLCNDTHCQTIGFLGDKEVLMPLLTSGIHGVDRVVPIGKTMDFDLLWDGYNLFERLTRMIVVNI